MPLSDSPSISEPAPDSEALFSGLVRRSSEGGETVDYLSAVSAFGRCIAAGPDLSVLLHDACELAALVVRADLLVVAQLTPDRTKLSLQLASPAGNRKVTVDRPEPIPAEPDISMAAFAMHSADITHSEDIGSESRFTDLLLRRRMMGSGVFAPLCSHNRAFGSFGLVRKEKGTFSREESNFTASLAHLLGSYLSQQAVEERMRDYDATLRATLDSIASPILVLDKQGVVREMNAAGVRISGFRNRELRDRPFWNTLIVPADSDQAAGAFRQNGRQGSQITFEADLLAKDGQERAIQWTLRSLGDGEGVPKESILSGVDVTELQDCLRELEKSRKIAQGAQKAAEKTKGTRRRGRGGPSGIEKRSSPRREYCYYQRIAPLIGGRPPEDDEFIRVICCDISAGGFSFLLEEKPTFDELVISLGTPPNDRKVVAKVVRMSEKDMNGQSMHQVGCQFLGRIEE